MDAGEHNRSGSSGWNEDSLAGVSGAVPVRTDSASAVSVSASAEMPAHHVRHTQKVAMRRRQGFHRARFG